jgi:hypothetical protein
MDEVFRLIEREMEREFERQSDRQTDLVMPACIEVFILYVNTGYMHVYIYIICMYIFI